MAPNLRGIFGRSCPEFPENPTMHVELAGMNLPIYEADPELPEDLTQQEECRDHLISVKKEFIDKTVILECDVLRALSEGSVYLSYRCRGRTLLNNCGLDRAQFAENGQVLNTEKIASRKKL